jgi:hypothetical protein
MARRTNSQAAKTPKIKNNENKTKMGISYPVDGRFSQFHRTKSGIKKYPQQRKQTC